MDELMITAIDGGNSEAIIQALLPMFGGIFLVLIAMHLVTAWLISRIAKKNGYPSPWLAYVPIAQFSVLLSLGGQSGKHVFWVFLPLVGMLVFLYFLIIATVNLCTNNGESKHFVWVLASPFVGLWGLYRLGNPGGGISLNKNQQALVQTCSSLIQQGKTEEEILGMMMQAGVSGGEVKMIYDLAKSGTKTTLQEEGSPTRKPLSGKVIAGLFILGFVINSIVGTVFGAVFGGLFNPGQLELEKEIEQELSGENLWDETVFETEDETITVEENLFKNINLEDIDVNEMLNLFETTPSIDPEDAQNIANILNGDSEPESIQALLENNKENNNSETQKQGVTRGVTRVPQETRKNIFSCPDSILEAPNECFMEKAKACIPVQIYTQTNFKAFGNSIDAFQTIVVNGPKDEGCSFDVITHKYIYEMDEELKEGTKDDPEFREIVNKTHQDLQKKFLETSMTCSASQESLNSLFEKWSSPETLLNGASYWTENYNCSGSYVEALKIDLF